MGSPCARGLDPAPPAEPAQPPPSAHQGHTGAGYLLGLKPQPKGTGGGAGLGAPGGGERTSACASGAVSLSLLICKMGTNPGPFSKNCRQMISSLAPRSGFPERSLCGLLFLVWRSPS